MKKWCPDKCSLCGDVCGKDDPEQIRIAAHHDHVSVDDVKINVCGYCSTVIATDDGDFRAGVIEALHSFAAKEGGNG